MKMPLMFAACILLTLTMACSIFAAQAVCSSPPNILFIIVDEMRWDAMSCAGHPIARTPHLATELARGGTRFDTTYTVAPVCVPSRYSLFTNGMCTCMGRWATACQRMRESCSSRPSSSTRATRRRSAANSISCPQTRNMVSNASGPTGTKVPANCLIGPISSSKNTANRRGDCSTAQVWSSNPLGRDIARLPYPKEDMQSFWITDRVDFLHQRTAEAVLPVRQLPGPAQPRALAEPYWSMFDPKNMPRPNIPEEVKQQRAKAAQSRVGGPGRTRSLIDNEEMAKVT